MPRSLSNRVRVRHVSGAEKDVLRSKLGQLGPNWERVTSRKKKRPPADTSSGVAEPSAESAPVTAEISNPVQPADPPDSKKE